MRLIFSVIFLFLSVFSGSSYAMSCNFDGNYSMNSSVVNLPSVVNLRGETAPGTLLWNSGWLNGGDTHITCSIARGTTNVLHWTSGYISSIAKSSYGVDIYETGIPGIGIKVYYSNSHDTGIDPQVLTYPATQTTAYLMRDSDYSPASEYRVEFWSTGTYSTVSTVFPSPLAMTKYDDLVTNQVTFSNTKFVVNLVGCSVKSSVNVDLGDTATTTFNGVGSAPDFQNFVIPLSCHSGTKIFTTIDATKDSSNVDGVIAPLSVTGGATGYGIQLYYTGGSAVDFGTKKLLTSSSSTTENIKLAARIYQTKDSVTVGKVSGVAYLTMTYE